MSLFSRDTFLRDYVFPVDAKHDFENAGGPAQLAAGHPKEWTQAENVFDFGVHLNEDEKGVHATYYTALSPDRKLLAISTTMGHILIYDIASRELKETLEGAGRVRFRPVAKTKETTVSMDQTVDGEGKGSSGYTLVSFVPAEGRSKASQANQLMLWDLDQHGQILDIEEAVDTSALSTKAIQAIAPELQKHHEWTMDFINTSTLHAKFAEALSQVSIDYRRRHNTILKDAQLGSYGSVSFSNDGRLLLYHSKNGMIPKDTHAPEKLPQLGLYDLDEGREIRRFIGHKDIIVWSAISPDSAHVGSVSFDGSLRMYSVTTGELEWATKSSEEQSWTGCFSPDSRLVAWSSRSGRVVQVRDVLDGRKLSTFPIQFFDCCRCLRWHPLRPELALCVGRDAYVWDVLNGPGGKMLQHFRIDDGPSFGNRMASVESVGWLAGGSMLHLAISDGTNIVYNTESNAKEIFKRSAGAQVGFVEGGMYGVFHNEKGNEYYVSVDGDAKVRYWQKGIPASDSWWERDRKPTSTATRTVPETGKYVKITKPSHRVADK